MTAAKLEEAHGNADTVPKIIKKAIEALQQEKVDINRLVLYIIA